MTMEILSNFISIYCYISFVIGAVLMLVALAIAAMGKDKEPVNKVKFFVVKRTSECYLLYLKGKGKLRYFIVQDSFFKEFGLNPEDFADMKEGEIREVFLNLED